MTAHPKVKFLAVSSTRVGGSSVDGGAALRPATAGPGRSGVNFLVEERVKEREKMRKVALLEEKRTLSATVSGGLPVGFRGIRDALRSAGERRENPRPVGNATRPVSAPAPKRRPHSGNMSKAKPYMGRANVCLPTGGAFEPIMLNSLEDRVDSVGQAVRDILHM